MRKIEKSAPPPAFRHWRASNPDATYDDLSGPDKDSAREGLCLEQGYLCAYCQARLRNDPLRMRIEHWVAQSANHDRDLEWLNLLGVCGGKTPLPQESSLIDDEPGSRTDQHCDRHRGSKVLHIHPARDPVVAEHFEYRPDGTVTSKDDDVLLDIGVLNLNHRQIKKNRAAVGERLQQTLGRGAWPKPNLEAELKRWTTIRAGELLEYAGVAEYLLRRWIRKRGT